MENNLAKFLGQELKGAIGSVQVAQGTARESGAPYYAIDLSFINGYKKRLFLRQDEQFAWTNAFEQLQNQSESVSVNFNN